MHTKAESALAARTTAADDGAACVAKAEQKLVRGSPKSRLIFFVVINIQLLRRYLSGLV